MISKEALEQIKCDLISTQCELFKDNCYDERVLAVYQLDALQIIKQDLERFEVLEKNSDKVVKDSVKLINKNLELQQLLEIERQAYKNLKELYDIDTKSLLQQNEKLKTENQILEQSVKDTYDTSQEIIYELKQEVENLKKHNGRLQRKHNKLLDENCRQNSELIDLRKQNETLNIVLTNMSRMYAAILNALGYGEGMNTEDNE